MTLIFEPFLSTFEVKDSYVDPLADGVRAEAHKKQVTRGRCPATSEVK